VTKVVVAIEKYSLLVDNVELIVHNESLADRLSASKACDNKRKKDGNTF
jgi:hypothetical protein